MDSQNIIENGLSSIFFKKTLLDESTKSELNDHSNSDSFTSTTLKVQINNQKRAKSFPFRNYCDEIYNREVDETLTTNEFSFTLNASDSGDFILPK